MVEEKAAPQSGDAGHRELAPESAPLGPAETIVAIEDAEEQITAFRAVERAEQADVLDDLPEPIRRRMLAELTDDEVATVLEHMPPDELVDALQLIDDVRAGPIREALPEEARSSAETLERHDPETAGGLMTDQMVHLPSQLTVGEAIGRLRTEVAEEELSSVYVSARGEGGVFIGAVPLRRLILAGDAKALGDIAEAEMITVGPETDQEEVVRLFTRHDLRELPVVSGSGTLLGVVAVDDVMEAAEEEGTEDMLLMAGSAEEEPAYNTLVRKAALRFPWLAVTLLGGMACSRIISAFGASILDMLALAFFIPVITSMAGSVALQCSTAMVRSMATGEFDMISVGRQIVREVGVGVMLGIGCGLVSGIAAFVMEGDPVLGGVVGMAMIAAVSFAALSGSMIPHVVNRLGIDPAIAAGPFITALNDMTGLTIYLGTATLVFARFGP